jgi:hypothetical protein
MLEQPSRKGFLHTLAWGDYVEVLETTAMHLRINTVKFEEKNDGGILPVKREAYICPTKSSGLKPADMECPGVDSGETPLGRMRTMGGRVDHAQS